MSDRKTPTIGALGIYTLRAPFTIDGNAVYECDSILSFKEAEVEQAHNVLNDFYLANGLSEAIYLSDRDAEVHIVVLKASGKPTIYVPDSYIDSYPNEGVVPYNHVILSISLGALPDQFSLDQVKADISNIVRERLNVNHEVAVHLAPATGAVTQSDHNVAETHRLSGVSDVVTDYEKLRESQSKVRVLTDSVLAYNQLLKDKNIIS
ncbi:hypothetical protein [Endozoicomonas sp. ONNA1]|uniref:DUF7194 family protein n=1 Tax=Endozoicomonas sp. ONNA1 TaxID=2828740 RepID=UPI002148BCF7|nr:hypothetical protein [Endozoicomonas sp. ONNA1]